MFVWGVGWLPRPWQAPYVRWRSGQDYSGTRLLSTREMARELNRHAELEYCLSVPQECPLSAECPVRSRWGYLQLAILRELASTTLSQLVNEVNQKEAPCQGLFAPGDIVVESLPAHKGAA